MKSGIVFVAVGVGLLLLILSQYWTQLFPGTSSWTPEKAEKWAAVKDRLHNLSFIVNSPDHAASLRRHPSLEAAKAEYEQVKQVGQQLQAEFESAYNTPRTTAAVLKWVGIFICGIGILGWLAVKESNS